MSPPPPTNYTVNTGRVQVPSLASERKGIQPVVELLADGSKRVQSPLGQSVNFTVKAQVPNQIVQIITVEFDPQGTGEYTKKDMQIGCEVELRFSFSYDKPGVYLASVRVASHRDGRTITEIAMAWNLDRVKVVVV